MRTTFHSAPRESLAAIAFFLTCAGSISLSGLLSGCEPATHPREVVIGVVLDRPPFSLSVVPGRSGITLAKKKPDEFYVVLANVSGVPQVVWESWNSWGYRAISFELTMADGTKFVLSKKQEEFTRNFPSTFVVAPGEYQVYPIKLDEWWETHPTLPKRDEMPITLKVVYEVTPTPEATQYKVWTGRVESHSYNFSLRQW
jgi:hypothetical protein